MAVRESEDVTRTREATVRLIRETQRVATDLQHRQSQLKFLLEQMMRDWSEEERRGGGDRYA